MKGVRLTLEELHQWFVMAKPGERIVYLRGLMLSRQRDDLTSKLAEAKRAELDGMAARALFLADERKLHLLQRRIGAPGSMTFEYIAEKRP